MSMTTGAPRSSSVTPGSCNPGMIDDYVKVDPPLAVTLASGPGGSTPGPINTELHVLLNLTARGVTSAGSRGTARPAAW